MSKNLNFSTLPGSKNTVYLNGQYQNIWVGVQEEFRENGVETEKNRDTSSNCDVCVTCDDVRCLL